MRQRRGLLAAVASNASRNASRLALVAALITLAAAAPDASQCDGWARSGECETNPIYMESACPVACAAATRSFIKDALGELEQCAGWADVGECTRNPKFMLATCPQNCKAQRAAVHEALLDELVTCIDEASSATCASDARVRTGCAGSCAILAMCRGEADAADCARALRCRELTDATQSCAAHVQRHGCDAYALKNCYLSCARESLAGLLRTFRTKYSVRTRQHGLLDEDRGADGHVAGVSAERSASLPRSPRGPPLPCWKGTLFDLPPAATCGAPRATLLQRWRAAAEPRCAALRTTTPRANPRRLVASGAVGSASASAAGPGQQPSPADLGAELDLPPGLAISVVPILNAPKVRFKSCLSLVVSICL